jgi:hypothetical protein
MIGALPPKEPRLCGRSAVLSIFREIQEIQAEINLSSE